MNILAVAMMMDVFLKEVIKEVKKKIKNPSFKLMESVYDIDIYIWY